MGFKSYLAGLLTAGALYVGYQGISSAISSSNENMKKQNEEMEKQFNEGWKPIIGTVIEEINNANGVY